MEVDLVEKLVRCARQVCEQFYQANAQTNSSPELKIPDLADFRGPFEEILRGYVIAAKMPTRCDWP
jgi:hypothetical protein